MVFYRFYLSILVEFYVTDSHGNLVNTTVIYDRMTADGQEFKLGKFRVIYVEEKGRNCFYIK